MIKDYIPPRAKAGSYAQWVRRAIRLARNGSVPIVSLFDSSVPEPRHLLQESISKTTLPDFSPLYVSAFGGGNPHVLSSLATQYQVSEEQVLCTTGATSSLGLIISTFGRPGDHILVESPGFDLFADLAEDRGMIVDTIDRRPPEYSFDIKQIEARILSNTRLILLSNLHNPSGMALDYMFLAQLARLAEKRGIIVVVDEVYGDYATLEERPSPACALSPAIISVSSLTKFHGLATLRCGWIVGATPVIREIRAFSTRLEFGVSNLAHAVAAQVLREPQVYVDYTNTTLAASRPIVDNWFAELSAEGLVEGVLPRSGCIFFPRLPHVADTISFAETLIASGVIVAPGEYFGAPGHIRIGFATAAEALAPALGIVTEALRAASAGADGTQKTTALPLP
ncbi:MAG TPA: pyridoxal phosphate-dependent aminotransferase [Sphingobium sp.]